MKIIEPKSFKGYAHGAIIWFNFLVKNWEKNRDWRLGSVPISDTNSAFKYCYNLTYNAVS